ncbi:MAG TPA: DNA replication and repair protein RecF, partial [Candidatus Saccharimonadales bacterium]|nr:DNA replication and repair protein RecF [Candidatus Saccharimonadales bacterium]
MILRSVYLQHFRSYVQQKFDFSDTVTVIIGPNTAGKTNLSEAISLLSTGKSFRTATDSQMIEFGQDIGRVGGLLEGDEEKTKIEVVLLQGSTNGGRFAKRFLVNGIGRSRAAVRSFLPLVLFRPEELDIVIASPGIRREFLDNVLEQTDKAYYEASIGYQKALRQRNALLSSAQETGYKNKDHFAYWDNLLIQNGQILTQKREEFMQFINTMEKDIFGMQIVYDHSKISEERLQQYEAAEIGAGNTLVGPHRDDFYLTMEVEHEARNIKHFGSRGQQRLVVLQLKLLQIAYMKEKLQKAPLLVLDDIFSEL